MPILTASPRLPVLFIGHGSPLNVILDNTFTQSLKQWGRKIPLPGAILVISAHWLTRGTYITSAAQPEQIYDFYGFPAELYRVKYPCVGTADIAQAICERITWINPDSQWGIDHAAWSILMHLFPTAPVPVLELSLDLQRSPAEHYVLARQLAWLREHGVLIIGSGNIVHNLRLVNFENGDAEPPDWAIDFDAAVKKALIGNQHHALINYLNWGQPARLAVPTNDHYLPLLYIAALQSSADTLTWIYEGFQNGSISMRCLQSG